MVGQLFNKRIPKNEQFSGSGIGMVAENGVMAKGFSTIEDQIIAAIRNPKANNTCVTNTTATLAPCAGINLSKLS